MKLSVNGSQMELTISVADVASGAADMMRVGSSPAWSQGNCRTSASRRSHGTHARKGDPVALKVITMSISKDFKKAVFTLIQERLVSQGFRKRKHGIFSLSFTEDVLGMVGLNTATGGRGPSILEIGCG
jgi:hypothetical protein